MARVRVVKVSRFGFGLPIGMMAVEMMPARWVLSSSGAAEAHQ
jgi:hypothetical protein